MTASRPRALAGLAWLVPTLLLPACSPSEPLACRAAPGAGSCPSLDGVTSFCSWSEWGCAPEAACGAYFALTDEGSDARLTYYYSTATGQFVATVEQTPGASPICLTGPASFVVPAGCAPDTLAECAPPPRDSGAYPDRKSVV